MRLQLEHRAFTRLCEATRAPCGPVPLWPWIIGWAGQWVHFDGPVAVRTGHMMDVQS
jgi:hypothetical protein